MHTGKGYTYCGYTLNRARFASMNFQRIYFAALSISAPPVKYRSNATCERTDKIVSFERRIGKTMGIRTRSNLFLNISILFKNEMIDVRRNHRELVTDSNRTSDSAIPFYNESGLANKRERRL
jgi:hypothetical protein